LLKALGASRKQIRNLFFAEATLLSALGAVVGLFIGAAGIVAIRQVYPAFPAAAPLWAIAAAVVTATLTGVGFSVMPARRASRLDPVIALAKR
jgi:putative ABC transport system permease protein